MSSELLIATVTVAVGAAAPAHADPQWRCQYTGHWITTKTKNTSEMNLQLDWELGDPRWKISGADGDKDGNAELDGSCEGNDCGFVQRYREGKLAGKTYYWTGLASPNREQDVHRHVGLHEHRSRDGRHVDGDLDLHARRQHLRGQGHAATRQAGLALRRAVREARPVRVLDGEVLRARRLHRQRHRRRLQRDDPAYSVAQRLAIVDEALMKHVLAQPVIGLDQTGWPRLETDATKPWQMWALTAPGVVVHRIRDDKSAVTFEALVGDYRGVIATPTGNATDDMGNGANREGARQARRRRRRERARRPRREGRAVHAGRRHLHLRRQDQHARARGGQQETKVKGPTVPKGEQVDAVKLYLFGAGSPPAAILVIRDVRDRGCALPDIGGGD